MRQLLVPAVATGVTALVLIGTGLRSGSSAAEAPAPDTIVAVTGDAANGFGIEHYDGTALYPPTDSEALAECGEYDARVDRVRCKAEVRTWYADLADLQQALDWAHTTD